MEVGLPEYDMAHIAPSLLAAAALYLSLKLLTESSWSDTLKYYSNYSEEEITSVVKSICKVIVKAESSKLQVKVLYVFLLKWNRVNFKIATFNNNKKRLFFSFVYKIWTMKVLNYNNYTVIKIDIPVPRGSFSW